MLMTTSAAGRGAAGACAWAACGIAHLVTKCISSRSASMPVCPVWLCAVHCGFHLKSQAKGVR